LPTGFVAVLLGKVVVGIVVAFAAVTAEFTPMHLVAVSLSLAKEGDGIVRSTAGSRSAFVLKFKIMFSALLNVSFV